MKVLLKYLKKYRKECILSPAFKLLEAIMDLLVPLVVAGIINTGIGEGDSSYITSCFILLIGLAVLGVLFSFTAQWFAAKASVGCATGLRKGLFDHIQSLSYTELDTLGTDTLITRMTSDINQVQNGVNLALRLVLRSPFIVFGAMVMAFTIDVGSALIFAVAIPVLGAVVFTIMLASIPRYGKAQKALDGLLGATRENLTGVRVIRAFCAEEREIQEFDRRNKALTRINEGVGKLSALMNPLTFLLINFATIFLIKTGALKVDSGTLRPGDIVALYNYMAQILVELIKLASLIITLNKSAACAGRIEEIFSVKSSMKYATAPHNSSATAGSSSSQASVNRHPSADPPAIAFRNVSFSYAGSAEEAISGIDFEITRGQTVGIIGGTGSGKTTLVNLIPRFYDATEGSIEIDGVDTRLYAEGELIKKIGVVPQKAVLFEGTIRDNIKWGNEEATDEEITKALEAAQAAEVIAGKEGGLSAAVEQGGRNFSGGQKQRLAIARALVKKPEILILDDSASALDYATDLRLRRAIESLPGEMTVFIVSQRTASVRNADLILVMDDGKLSGKGTHDELLRNNPIYREIYYSQFPEEKST